MATSTKSKTKKHTVSLTTGIGTLSFPHVHPDTKGTKDDNVTPDYSIQIIIPKSDRKSIAALVKAVEEVGLAAYGDRWKSVANPLRDGDAEADSKWSEDGVPFREKYPERLGCYIFNARSQRQPAVVRRDNSPLTESSDLYGGCKGRLSVTAYPYSTNGNTGIGFALDGVQKVAEGEPFGAGAKAVDSMFDVLDDDADLGLDDVGAIGDAEPDEEPKAKKKKAKKNKG